MATRSQRWYSGWQVPNGPHVWRRLSTGFDPQRRADEARPRGPVLPLPSAPAPHDREAETCDLRAGQCGSEATILPRLAIVAFVVLIFSISDAVVQRHDAGAAGTPIVGQGSAFAGPEVSQWAPAPASTTGAGRTLGSLR
jgi:hypothetical protein